MIVPQFWSEAKSVVRREGKQATIMRFGWSDVSEADAHEHAETRVSEAVSRYKAGEDLRRIDHKVKYNGAEGLPIREEIISRHDDAVLTRNSYGAMCINTPDVMFTDIDVDVDRNETVTMTTLAILFAIAAGTGWYFGSWLIFLALGVVAIALSEGIGTTIYQAARSARGNPYTKTLERVEAWSSENRSWHLRVYRTPKGFRILVMHDTFEPRSDAALDFMRALKSDKLYALMCRNQNCFRARVSPKPWRIDIEHIRPGSSVWPIKDEHLGRRRQWVEEYNRASTDYASCRYVRSFGSTSEDRKCVYIRDIHDELCKSNSQLELA